MKAKPYHLTQEQALEILKPLGFTPDPIKGAVFVPSNGRGSLSLDVLQTAFNAALDKVLGEPEIYMAKSLENGTYATHPRKSECELFLAQSKLKNDGKQATVLTLYAPKDMT